MLLADDNDINREVLKALLDPFGFVIDEAENGKVAVDMAEKILYDLILMDSHMPVMSGKEAAGKSGVMPVDLTRRHRSLQLPQML